MRNQTSSKAEAGMVFQPF